MISIKTGREIDLMRRAGDILARCVLMLEQNVADGVVTSELDRLAAEFMRKHNAIASFFGVPGMVDGAPGFPASVCVSVNDEVIHGIPGGRRIKDGDIVSVDMGAIYMGYHSDMARTFCVGAVPEEAARLVRVTMESFYEGMLGAAPGNRISDISRRVQAHAEAAGYSVVRDFVGHGIGTEMHEPPQIPNFVTRGERGARLAAGMTLAIEPMVNAGAPDIDILPNKWTVATRDRSLSAHYENTILVVADGQAEILSAPA
ncbi:MAG: type I methionyl aminopeptidase [Clostridiales bacterium]|nr:type I methionyl aminopeptidase [Clostridiales bacterium]